MKPLHRRLVLLLLTLATAPALSAGCVVETGAHAAPDAADGEGPPLGGVWNEAKDEPGLTVGPIAHAPTVAAPLDVPLDAPCDGWEYGDFAVPSDTVAPGDAALVACGGQRMRRYDPTQELWVGLVDCGDGYRFYLSERPDEGYLPAADLLGHGQDFCELLDPSFTLVDEEDMGSASCTACSTGPRVVLTGDEAFVRARVGERFARADMATLPAQTSVVSCGLRVGNCVLPAPPRPLPTPPLPACAGWERAELALGGDPTLARDGSCTETYRRLDHAQGLWVGVLRCGEGDRFYLSEARDGVYLPAADREGQGEDFCELLDPDFVLISETDITSGGCTTCATSRATPLNAGEVFARARFGEPFVREVAQAARTRSALVRCGFSLDSCVL